MQQNNQTQMINPNANNINNNNMMQRNNMATNNQSRNIDFTKMPVVNAVNTILLNGVSLGASDIHFDPTDDGIVVRYRIDGVLNNF